MTQSALLVPAASPRWPARHAHSLPDGAAEQWCGSCGARAFRATANHVPQQHCLEIQLKAAGRQLRKMVWKPCRPVVEHLRLLMSAQATLHGNTPDAAGMRAPRRAVLPMPLRRVLLADLLVLQLLGAVVYARTLSGTL